jgi:hypothetical protein
MTSDQKNLCKNTKTIIRFRRIIVKWIKLDICGVSVMYSGE